MITQMCHITLDNKIPALFVMDDNMGKDEFLLSMFAYYYDIITNDILSVLNDFKNKALFEKFSEILSQSPLYIMKWSYDERENKYEELEKAITENGLKIVFFDECFCLPQIRDYEFSIQLKQIAVNYGLPIVVAYQTWYQNREMTDTCVPTLHDFSEYSHFKSDVVIAFIDYEDIHILVGERGSNYHGILGIRILKQKGMANGAVFHISRNSLFMRDRAMKLQKKSLQDILNDSGNVRKPTFAEEDDVPF